MWSAVSHAWQSWNHSKAVAALAIAALAVGIGSATAIYTVVNTVMLRPLPYPEGERFVALYGASLRSPEGRSSHTYPTLLEYQQRTQSFDVFGWFRPEDFNLTAPGQPQHVDGAAVTPSLVHHLGVGPAVGRWFQDDTGAVLSHALWTTLGADPTMVGKPVTLNGRSYTVTGVMPPGFRLPVAGPGGGPVRSDVWIFLDPRGRGQSPGEGSNFCYARRKPGVTLPQAEADVKRVAADIARGNPALEPSYTARLDDLHNDTVESIRPTLLLLLAAAGLLLGITCANVAALLLARAVARARETAVRVALGAARRALALQYFVEGLFVSLSGAAAGVVMSLTLVRVVVSVAADYIPRADEIAIDWRVLLFAIGLAVVSSALSSLAPLWQAMRTLPVDVLRDGVRVSAGARSRRLSRSLVIAEVALAFALLAGSVALLAHLDRLTRVWPGFDPDRVLTFQVMVSDTVASGTAYSSSPKRAAYHRRLIDAVAAVPGVERVAIVNQVPLDGCCFGAPLYPDGRALKDVTTRTALLSVSPGYVHAMGIPIRDGRFLTEEDGGDEPIRIAINEAAARFFWPERNPLGASGRLGHPDKGARFEVVGVVGDVRNDGLGKPTVPEIFISSTILPVNPIWFVVRSPLPPGTLVPAVRRAVQQLEPSQPIQRVATMREIARASVSLERVASLMTAFFAGAALLMAMLGIYGVVSYTVRQDTVEIGTRVALGAVRGDIFRMVIGGGLKMALAGIALGAVAVVTSAWFLARTFHFPELGWSPFVTATAIVAGIATLASFFPAWRAMLLSPMAAMRR